MDLRSLDRTCGGTGYLNCECGGDFCVCKLNGGMDCSGCEDCRDNDYDEDSDWDYPDQQEDSFRCPCGAELSYFNNPQQCPCLREHATPTSPATKKETPAL